MSVMWGWNPFKKREYPILLDALNSFPMTMPPEHNAVHNGIHFHLVLSDDHLGNNSNPDDIITLSFKTQSHTGLADEDKRWCHMIFSAKGTATSRYRVIEGKTGGGAVEASSGIVTPQNSFRPLHGETGHTSTLIDLAASPAVNSVSTNNSLFTGGTTLHDEYLGEGSTGAIASRGAQEWVLKPDTFYQVSLYDTQGVFGTIEMTWYEYDHQNFR